MRTLHVKHAHLCLLRSILVFSGHIGYSLNHVRLLAGDDMGLGKTMETCAFLAGMLHSRLAARVLIIAPKTLLAHWKKELAACGLAALTYEFYGSSQCDRCRPSLLSCMPAFAGVPREGVTWAMIGSHLHYGRRSSLPAGTMR